MENMENIDELIVKYLAGETNANESEILIAWTNESSQNKKYFSKIKDLWDVIVRLQDLKKFDVELAKQKVKKRIPEFKKRYSIIHYFQRIAAIIILPLIVGTSVYVINSISTQNKLVSQNELVTSPGTFTKVTLSDGTEVWVNAGSKFSYPTIFVGNNRNVELDGEAYFSVKPNKKKPFIVKTKNAQIKVLGTSFNIAAYSNEKKVETTLVEGSVSFEAKIDNKAKNIIIKPNQKVEFNYSTNKLSVTDVDVRSDVSWKNGKMEFHGNSLEEITTKLSRKYNVEFQFANEKLKNLTYTATFTNENLNEVLQLLSISSPIRYNIITPESLSDLSYSKMKITISNRPNKKN